MTTIAIIGLGEAGTEYARGLRAAGADVRGYDPYRRDVDPGIHRVRSIAEAVTGADAVLSLVVAAAALEVAGDVLPLLGGSCIYADLNTAAPAVKEGIAAMAARRGVPMTDVAVLAPVLRAGHRTALLASGAAAAAFAALVSPFEVPVDALDAPAGEAARLKLLRSVFMKGLAALVIEGLTAARAAGAEQWLHGQIAAEFGPGGGAFVDRLVAGTHRHAVRREQEVRDACEALEAAGQHSDMTRATLAWFERIVAEGGPAA